MKITVRFKLTFLLVIILSTYASAQAQHFDSVLSKLDREYPQEKLYLHFDRSVYNAGETIWFKAYIFSGINLSVISKTMYAEMIDDKGEVLKTVTAPLLQSTAAGSFEIPASTTGDVVYIRAYTKWMLNFDSSFLFVKALPIITKKPSANGKALTSSTSLEFFPEGGDLVEGVLSRVAFKATDEHGFPVTVKGDLLNAEGKKLLSFASVHDGMGQFEITPGKERYKAVWKDERKQTHETLLPVALKNAVALQVNNMGNKIDYAVSRTGDSTSSNSEVSIVAQLQHQLVYRAKGKLALGATITASIPVDSLPAGILQITVFNRDEQPLAERIVFINQQDYYFITDLNAATISTSKRQKNVIQVDVPDTLHCNLSVAVTDADLNESGESKDNIFSHVLLTGDLRGYIHNPGFYFSSEADSVVSFLDLVMMTNGWRRFNWTDALANRWPALQYKPDDYLGIEGKVYGVDKGLLRNKELMGILKVKDKANDLLTTEMKNDGSFIFNDLLFYDTAQIYYQFNNDKNKSLTSQASFQIKSTLLSPVRNLQPGEGWLYGYNNKDSVITRNASVADKYFTYLNREKTKVLKTVVIKAKQKSKKELMDEQYTSGLFSGGDDYTFITEDDPSANASQTVLSYLQGKVAGLQVNLTGATPSLSWRGGTPSLFVNETPTDVDAIQSVYMSDVAMVKVFRPPFLGAFGGGSGGAIAVYYKKGASRNSSTATGLTHSTISGYSPVKEFYTPDYSTDPGSLDPDIRTTLYWNPYLLTDRSHRRLFLTFYNNDISKKFRVIIEGCNELGKLTRIEKVFTK